MGLTVTQDAEEIVNNFNGKAFLGQNIIVEFAKENRRRDNYEDRGYVSYLVSDFKDTEVTLQTDHHLAHVGPLVSG